MSTVTMEELELETAELLPARETLCHYKPPCRCAPPPCQAPPPCHYTPPPCPCSPITVGVHLSAGLTL
jgi:hypothetical protein